MWKEIFIISYPFCPFPQVTGVNQQTAGTANVHVSGNVAALKGLPAVATAQQNAAQAAAAALNGAQVFQQGATQIVQQNHPGGNITYNVIPQQIQNIQIDGQDAIYIPTMPQTFQISGNQIIQSPNGQTFLRAAQNVPTSVQNGAQGILQGMQIGGQNVTIR